ncbi:MAG: extracellular solute-binding protein [Chloroflexota bacterium]
MLLRSTFLTPVQQLFESLVASWSTQNDIPVEFTWGTFEVLNDTLVSSASTSAGPDVIQIVNTRPHQFAEALLDVSDAAEAFAENEGAWYPLARDICQVDGVWRSMPHFLTPFAMVYREDLFAEVGFDTFPETWEELLEAGTALKAAGTPIGFPLGRAQGDGSNFLYSLLWSFGASVTDETGTNIVLDSAETRDALTYVQQLYNDAMDPNVLAWDDGSNNRAMLGGEVSATVNSASILFAARNDGLEIADVINHAKYPMGPAGRIQQIELTSTGIMNYAGNTEAAIDMATYFNSPEVWLPLARDGFAFFIPAFEGFEENPAMPWNTDPKLAAFKGIARDGAHFGYPGPPTPEANEVFVNFVINDMFAMVASGAASIDDAVAQATEAVQDIYEQ